MARGGVFLGQGVGDGSADLGRGVLVGIVGLPRGVDGAVGTFFTARGRLILLGAGSAVPFVVRLFPLVRVSTGGSSNGPL